jgi:hypothetical protein
MVELTFLEPDWQCGTATFIDRIAALSILHSTGPVSSFAVSPMLIGARPHHIVRQQVSECLQYRPHNSRVPASVWISQRLILFPKLLRNDALIEIFAALKLF